MSHELRSLLRESVPYVKIYRYNPKHLCPKLNGYGDNGQRSVKFWQLLHTYWLPNTYENWQEYVVFVMLISVLNIKLNCDIKPLNWTTKTLALMSYLSLGFQALYMTWMPSTDLYCLITKKEVHKQFGVSMSWNPVIWHHTQGWTWIRLSADRYSAWTRQKTTLFSDNYLRNRSTLDIGVLGYIDIL